MRSLLIIVLCALSLVGCCRKTVYDQQYYLDALGVELDEEEGNGKDKN